MKIIGLSGYARSGKDTVAGFLVDGYEFNALAFADVLRDCAYALNPIVAAGAGRNIYLQDVIDSYTWDNYKESAYGQEVRRILQNFGTDVGRDILGEDIWVDTAMKRAESMENVVFTDCRFPNEAQLIADLGGEVWRINRPGTGPAKSPDGSTHKSETALDSWNFGVVLSNDSDLEGLNLKVKSLFS